MPISPSQTPILEGQGLVYGPLASSGLTQGQATVRPATGASGEVFAGVAFSYVQPPTNGQFVDIAVVPSAPGPFTFQLSQASVINPNTDVGIFDTLGNAWTNTGGSAPTTARHFSVSATGLVTFDSSGGVSPDSGTTLNIYYQFALSVAQVTSLFGSNYAFVGNTQASQVIGTMGVIKQSQFIYTDQYDPGVNWGANNINNITLSAGGIFTRGGSGATVPGTVIQVPDGISFPSPYLGISIFSQA
jgi:hypothetical protein